MYDTQAIEREDNVDSLLETLLTNPEVRLSGVDDTGLETWESSLADFVDNNRDDMDSYLPVLNLAIGTTVRVSGYTGCYVNITRTV